MFVSDYSLRGFTKTKELVRAFSEFTKIIDFDTIACRGTSGLIVAPILSHVFDKNLTVVQKKSTRRHSLSIVDGFRGGEYVIVDDFIESGKTVKAIIKECSVYGGVLKGIFLYNGGIYLEPLIKKLNVPIFRLDLNLNLIKN